MFDFKQQNFWNFENIETTWTHLVVILDAVAEVVLGMCIGVRRLMAVTTMSTPMSTSMSTPMSTPVSTSYVPSSEASTTDSSTTDSSCSESSAELWKPGDEGGNAESKQTDEGNVELEK
jgi:hypothetical protein